MAVSVTEYRRAVKLARWRLREMIKYWSKHPYNPKVYESYLNKVLMAIVNLKKQGFDEPLPSDLFGWEKTYSRGIDSYKSLTNLYEKKTSDNQHVKFLRYVLDHAEPTNSPAANLILDAELKFVIEDPMCTPKIKKAAIAKRERLNPSHEHYAENADFDQWASEFEAVDQPEESDLD